MASCPKCGTEVSEEYNFCPNCQTYLKEVNVHEEIKKEKEPTILSIFALCLGVISFILSLIPIRIVIVLIGLGLSLICLGYAVFEQIKCKNRLSAITITISSVAFVTSVFWTIFIYCI